MSQSKFFNKKVALIGAGALAVGGLLYYFLNSDSVAAVKVNTEDLYSDEQMIAIAKDLKKATFPAFESVANMAKAMIGRFCMENRMDPRNAPAELKKQVFSHVIENNPNFPKQLEQIEKDVVETKHGLDINIYRATFDAKVSSLPILKETEEFLAKSTSMAGEGNLILPPASQLPETITPAIVFEILLSGSKTRIL